MEKDLPELNRDPSFWGMVVTMFLGAFNDNFFKQMMLLLAIPVGAAAAQQDDAQGLATVIFSLPFVLFSGFAGYLSDRYSKRRVIVLAKVAEIVAMALGMTAFLLFPTTGYTGLLVVLFLMGMQSSFFGPGKFGILPELFRNSDLPRANGIIVMATFVAIIMGTVSAGFLKTAVTDEGQNLEAQRLWIGSAICIGIAVVGTCTSLVVRRVAPANPNLGLTRASFSIPKPTLDFLRSDRDLLCAILASSVFWLVSGIAIQAVNSLGRVQLQLTDDKTSILAGVIAIGIAVGAVVAGKISQGKTDFRIVRVGMWGIALWLCILSISPGGVHLLKFAGSIPVLILLGASAGFFAIPLQVFIQSRPPDDQKGQMIAVMNQANFIAILLSGVVYSLFDRLVKLQGWPRSYIFAMMALLILPMAVFYRPKNATA